MKTTPFQQALKNELHRIERIKAIKPAKNKHFLVQFFQHVLSF